MSFKLSFSKEKRGPPATLGTIIWGRGTSKHKDPEMGTGLACLQDKTGSADEHSHGENGGCCLQGVWGTAGHLALTLGEIRSQGGFQQGVTPQEVFVEGAGTVKEQEWPPPFVTLLAPHPLGSRPGGSHSTSLPSQIPWLVSEHQLHFITPSSAVMSHMFLITLSMPGFSTRL